jgi:hypothetical protein
MPLGKFQCDKFLSDCRDHNLPQYLALASDWSHSAALKIILVDHSDVFIFFLCVVIVAESDSLLWSES